MSEEIKKLKASQIFVPNKFPKYTYVNRNGDNFEKKLRNALETSNSVISLSGPSKSGKTVLVEKVVGIDYLITVSGAELSKAEDLWQRVLDWIGVPDESTEQSASGNVIGATATFGGGVNFLGVAKADATGGVNGNVTKTNTNGVSYNRRGLNQVEKEISNSAFVVFIDDFHYMDRELQLDVAKQIRAAIGKNITICVASVPHRSDDIVRSNHELRGRTCHIDTNFWSVEELQEIGKKGFEELNIELSDADIKKLAIEACGSPQLMQQICLQFCFKFDKREKLEQKEIIQITDDNLKDILEQSASYVDYSSLVQKMHEGPKTRGTERKEYNIIDGSKGDVYRVLLFSISQDPPQFSIPYDALLLRVESVCNGDFPGGRSITSTCQAIQGFAESLHPQQRIIEWDEETGNGTLSISDPYLLFYIRSSRKLDDLKIS